MDKLPRLRRKPKPPTIETTVDRTSTDTESNFSSPAASNYNGNTTAAAALADSRQSPNPPSQRQFNSNWFKGERSSSASRKKSPFRLIRPSAKRARESSPAAVVAPADSSSNSAAGSPQTLQVPGQGGVKFPRNGYRSRQKTAWIYDDDASSADGVAVHPDPGPQMPAFLKLSKQGDYSISHMYSHAH